MPIGITQVPHCRMVGKVSYLSDTSLKVKVDIYLEEMYSTKRYKAVSGEFTFVAIDDNKKPIAING